MTKLNVRIAEEIAEWKAATGQTKFQRMTKVATALDDDIRRLIIIGGFVADKFPEVLQYQPQSSEPENQAEFLPLLVFLALLESETEFIDRLKNKASLLLCAITHDPD